MAFLLWFPVYLCPSGYGAEGRLLESYLHLKQVCYSSFLFLLQEFTNGLV